jgi:hypothetical protein
MSLLCSLGFYGFDLLLLIVVDKNEPTLKRRIGLNAGDSTFGKTTLSITTFRIAKNATLRITIFRITIRKHLA